MGFPIVEQKKSDWPMFFVFFFLNSSRNQLCDKLHSILEYEILHLKIGMSLLEKYAALLVFPSSRCSLRLYFSAEFWYSLVSKNRMDLCYLWYLRSLTLHNYNEYPKTKLAKWRFSGFVHFQSLFFKKQNKTKILQLSPSILSPQEKSAHLQHYLLF